MTDRGRHLLFLSNFDGSWESYLGDFIDRASPGITAIGSNCVGFPATRFLIKDGASDEQTFKYVTRKHQSYSQVWYSAYPTLSVANINNSTEISNGLFTQMTPEEVRKWLKRF